MFDKNLESGIYSFSYLYESKFDFKAVLYVKDIEDFVDRKIYHHGGSYRQPIRSYMRKHMFFDTVVMFNSNALLGSKRRGNRKEGGKK